MKAANDHVEDVGPKGITSSLGSGKVRNFELNCSYIDGSLPTDRLTRYCNIDESWAESMCFQCLTAQEVVEHLIVNDGQQARGHRKNMFNKEFTYCGIATGKHEGMDNIILIEYCKNILKEGELPQINITVTEEVP